MSQTQTSGMYERYTPEYAPPVPCVTHTKALEIACYFHNRCEELTEILELFCADAAIAALEKSIEGPTP